MLGNGYMLSNSRASQLSVAPRAANTPSDYKEYVRSISVDGAMIGKKLQVCWVQAL